MAEKAYTLAMWKVKPGCESEFIEAWKQLGKTFHNLASPPGTGVLLQSLTDSSTYYSFGPWESADAISAMREDPAAQDGIRKLMDLCTEATPGGFRLVAEA